MIFETDRLWTRELREADREAFCDLVCDPAVMRYITGKPMPEAEANGKFDEYLACRHKPGNTFHVWAAIQKEDDTMIGTAALIFREPDIDRDLGYRLRQSYWGNGYGAELAFGLARHAFGTLLWPYVTADVDWANAWSIAILDRFMERTGSEWLADEDCGVHYYRCSREQFYKRIETQMAP